MTTTTTGRRLGIHSIGGFSLAVPSLTVAKHFYTAFGLATENTGEGFDLLTQDGRTWGTVVHGTRKHMRHLAFHCYAEDLPALRDRLVKSGVALVQRPAWYGNGDGFWFHDPDGLLLHLRSGAKMTPDHVTRAMPALIVDGQRAAVSRQKAPRVHPTRLSHIMRFTPDLERAIGFYRDVLGLRLSDRSGDKVAFLHGPHGSDHHLMAFAKSEGTGLHHLSWDVPTIDDVGLGAMQMAEAGYRDGWGIGRHVLGSNYFYYVEDPWGSFCEYSCGMDFIPAAVDWHAEDHPLEDSSYLWGPAASPRMRRNTELD